MAYKTLTKCCPFCQKVYEQRTFISRGKTVTDEERWLFGSPLRMCPHCKRMFVDSDLQEMALTGPRKQDKAPLSPGVMKLALMGVTLGALMMVAGQYMLGYIAAGVGIVCAIVDLALYPTRMKKLEQEQKASQQRLSDPAYAQLLKNAGYPVPEQYL